MIKKIRYKFVAITLISLTLLLSFLMIAINWTNFNNVTRRADRIIDVLENKDNFDPKPMESVNAIGVETPYETRFFVAKFIKDSEECLPYEINMTSVKAINEEEASLLSVEVYNKSKCEGYKKNYRFRKYQSKKKENEVWITFVDCSRQLEMIDNFFKTSIIVLSIGLCISFIIIFFISKIIIRPIEESDARQKKFITDAGHELKTPLTIISANNELQEMLNGENEMTKTISKEVDKMSMMVKNMTELAKMSEITSLSKKESAYFSLTDILNSSCKDFANAFSNKNIIFKYVVAKNVYIKGKENKIKELISIILDNALKYSKSQCYISLIVSKNDIVILEQNDAEDLKIGSMDQIFSRFYRTEEARASEVEGSGIGLSIAKEIVNVHRGKITAFVDSNLMFNIKISFAIYKKKK